MRRSLPTSVGVAILLVAVLATTAVATTVVRVDEDGEGGWLFNRDASTSTPYEFSLDEASIGDGSLHVLPIGSDPADKFIAEQFLGVVLDDVEQISYDFQIEGDAADANYFYVNVYTNYPGSNPDNFYDCRFDYVATAGSATSFTTMEVNSTDTPTFVATRGSTTPICPSTLDEMPEGSWLRVFSINVGDTSANDAGVGGYLDNVTATVAGVTTTWDFEVPLQVKDDCKDGGWETYGFTNQGECVSALQANPNAGK